MFKEKKHGFIMLPSCYICVMMISVFSSIFTAIRLETCLTAMFNMSLMANSAIKNCLRSGMTAECLYHVKCDQCLADM